VSDLALVTGVSGYLGGHIALELLRQGFQVRGSVRDLSKANAVRTSLAQAGVDVAHLELCALDLLKDEGWREAAVGCRYLHHVASPFVLTMPKNDNDLIRPAVEGTRRAVEAALAAGAERIVLTSSLAAIDGGHRNYDRALGAGDWSDLEGPHVTSYTKSKTRAEKEAWLIVEHAGARERLAVVNPGTMLGPLLGDDPGTSAVVIQRLLGGDVPMLPDLILPYVDVRDVAAAQVAAMTSPQAVGARTIVTNPAQSLTEIAQMLRARLGAAAGKVPVRRMPSWMAALAALFDPSLRDAKGYVGIRRHYDVSGGPALLGRPLRTTEGAVEATARSLIERSLI
jgi:nucleoside-diphosphate-sugar epimerase